MLIGNDKKDDIYKNKFVIMFIKNIFYKPHM
jgi:hypothetical protein